MGGAVMDVSEQRAAIEYGVKIELFEEPPTLRFGNTKALRTNESVAVDRLKEYDLIGAIECLPAEPAIVQPLHIVIKDDRKPRLVLDLSRNLNEWLDLKQLKYEDLDVAVAMSTPMCWYGKHDLSDCYLSFPVHMESRKYLSFALRDKYYRFTRLPFGLSTAPRTCTLLLDVVSYELRRRGVKHVRYLDDFLYIG